MTNADHAPMSNSPMRFRMTFHPAIKRLRSFAISSLEPARPKLTS